MLGTTVVVSPQLLGGVYGWGISIITTMAALSCLAAWWAAREKRTRKPVPAIGWAGIGLLVWTCVQAVPLPRAVAGWLQPDAVEMADAAARLLGRDEPGWVALSISPFGTQSEIVKWAGIVAVLFAAILVSHVSRRRRVFQMVAASTVLMAVVAFGHLAANADRVFGIYEQIQTASAFLAPLVNQNHLSGFLAMGVPVLVGLGLDEEERGPRFAHIGVAAVVGAGALLCVSRGGVASLVVGLLVLGALSVVRSKRKSGAVVGPLLVVGATLAIAAGLGLYVASEALFRDFEHGDLGKLELIERGLALALEHPFVGVGRGAFTAAFVSQHGSEVRYTHPENLLAQWTGEWGVLVGAFALIVLGWAVTASVKRARSWSHLGAISALGSITAHELVDFSTELMGVAVVVAALGGAALTRERRDRMVVPGRSDMRRVAVGLAIAAGVSVAVFGWGLERGDVYSLQGRLVTAMEAADRDRFRSVLEDAVGQHPAEPTFPLLAGAEAVRHRDPTALAWLNRAMSIAPGWDAPHLEAARYLAARGRARQALLELREAQQRRRSGATLTCRILKNRPEASAELLAVAGMDAPDGGWTDADGNEWLNEVASCLPLDSPAALGLDEVLAERGVADARLRTARRELVADAPEAALRTLGQSGLGTGPQVRLLRSQALLAADRPEEAARLLSNAGDWPDNGRAGLRLRARAQARSGDLEGMRSTTQQLRGRAAGRARRLAEAWVFEGSLEAEVGNHGRAIRAYERAQRLDPEAGALIRLARLAERMGDAGRAYRAYAELCRHDGMVGPHCEARDRVRGAAGNEPPPGLGQLPEAP